MALLCPGMALLCPKKKLIYRHFKRILGDPEVTSNLSLFLESNFCKKKIALIIFEEKKIWGAKFAPPPLQKNPFFSKFITRKKYIFLQISLSRKRPRFAVTSGTPSIL